MELENMLVGKTLIELENMLAESKVAYKQLRQKIPQYQKRTIKHRLKNKEIIAPEPNKGEVEQLNFLSVKITKLETEITVKNYE